MPMTLAIPAPPGPDPFAPHGGGGGAGTALGDASRCRTVVAPLAASGSNVVSTNQSGGGIGAATFDRTVACARASGRGSKGDGEMFECTTCGRDYPSRLDAALCGDADSW